MKNKFNCIKVFHVMLIISIIALFGTSTVFAADLKQFPYQSSVSPNKVWTIKFNMDINWTTMDLNKIVVKDGNNAVDAKASPGSSADEIVINPPTGGYIPEHTYSLSIGGDILSITGKPLSHNVSMDFKINNELEDGTSYDGLPAVASCDLAVRPLGSGSKEIFRLLSQNGDSVQYRVFVSLDGSGKYEELTNGYTNPVDGNSLYTLSPSKVFTAGKYKLFTYVRRANVQGTYTDSNTDYDNYLVTYFNCLSSVTSSSLTSVNSSYTLKQVVDNEYSRQPTYDNGGKWDVASRSMVEYYLNPYNFMDDTGKYQFLNLNYKDNYTADDLNKILSGKGVLDGKGAVFLKAAKDANIDVAYLVSHSLLETGNGTSNLAKGIDVNSVKVYNMFGIGAVDAAAEKGGSETAYKNGWFTVDDAICGGASWIASGYISNIKFMQNTDYKMRWNPDVIWHQYATDVNWASAQSKNIKKIMDNYPGASLVFEIPKYK